MAEPFRSVGPERLESRVVPPAKRMTAAEKKKAERKPSEDYRVICRFGQCLFQASADSEEDALEVAAKHTEAKGHPRVDVKPPPPRVEAEPETV
jgi:hypothetical protein